MTASYRRSSPRAVFPLLMLLSALMWLAPPSWTNWLRIVTPTTTWLIWTSTVGARAAVDAVAPTTSPASPEIDALRLQIAHLSAALQAREEQLSEITSLRDPLGGADAKVIIASVIGESTSTTGSSLTIAVPSVHAGLVRPGDWVAAASDADRDEADGWKVLTRSWIVGRISSEKPGRLLKVQLTTDPGFGGKPGFGAIRVRAARVLADGSLQIAPIDCLLYGAARNRMVIRETDQNYFADGFDRVLLPIAGANPAFLTIGRISGATAVPDNALYFNLQVEPWGDVGRLSRVYVLSLGSQP